jgi:hypothetical protein
MEQPDWNKNDLFDGANSLFKYVEQKTQESIQWYLIKKNPKKTVSIILRCLAIIFTSIGGLIPLIASAKSDSVLWGIQFNQFGYISLLIAASCVGFDKFFGLSSSWMRFMSISLVLEKHLQDLQLEWSLLHLKYINQQNQSVELIEHMVNRLREFSFMINALVEKETKEWIAEFQTNLAQLENNTKQKLIAGRPEHIEIKEHKST